MHLITVLGSTGSIGVNTLNVLRLNKDKYRVFALTAHSNIELLAEQCVEFNPEYAVVADQSKHPALEQLLLTKKTKTKALAGADALAEVASDPNVDSVMAAIVGGAGLAPTYAAALSGKKVMLANKEALVMSGSLFTKAIEESGGQLLPVDSEHNAIFQCLPNKFESLQQAGIHKILLTGSGGPFRDTNIAELGHKTPEEACAHPNWEMGRKISVDSATMMNKGLEFIEACWLFHAKPSEIEVIIHPQSIVHSMVQYHDGSTLAQMGTPDMRTPIAHCLAYPDRIQSGAKHLDFTDLSNLSFYKPDFQRYPCLKLALDCFEAGSSHAAVLNAANEIAVDAFLNRQISFNHIAQVNQIVVEKFKHCLVTSIEQVVDCDKSARIAAASVIKGISL